MKLPCVMLAREGSKRLPGKNRLAWYGKPLWLNAIECAARAEHVSRVHLVTDLSVGSLAEYQTTPAQCWHRVMPDGHTSHEGVDWWRKQAGLEASYCLLIQCTSPFINPADLDRLIEIAFADGLPSEIWALGDRGKPCGMGYVIPPGSQDTVARRFVKPDAPMIDIDTMEDYEQALRIARAE